MHTTLVDLVSWFFLCILAVFSLGGFYIDHATKYPKPKEPTPADDHQETPTP